MARGRPRATGPVPVDLLMSEATAGLPLRGSPSDFRRGETSGTAQGMRSGNSTEHHNGTARAHPAGRSRDYQFTKPALRNRFQGYLRVALRAEYSMESGSLSSLVPSRGFPSQAEDLPCRSISAATRSAKTSCHTHSKTAGAVSSTKGSCSALPPKGSRRLLSEAVHCGEQSHRLDVRPSSYYCGSIHQPAVGFGPTTSNNPRVIIWRRSSQEFPAHPGPK